MQPLPVEQGARETMPRCRHFGVCGGCQMQHLRQASQVARKVEAIQERLARASVSAPPIAVHTDKEYGYRNRVRFRLENGRVGYSLRASHVFLPVVECPILAPPLWPAAAEFERLTRDGFPLPDASTEVEFSTNGDGTALQMLLHVDRTVGTLDREAPRHFRVLCEAMQRGVPQLAGSGLLVHGAAITGSRRVQERQRLEVARWGVPELVYLVNDIRYQVSRGAFFQVNRFLTRRMVDLVLGNRCGRLAWDLFAGAGLFSVPLAMAFGQVVAVEVGEPAASDLANAFRKTGPQHRAVAQPVLNFLKQQTGAAPELIVMDPPRAGLGSAVTHQLARIAAPELVYVSCDATTFARDARALIDSRYTVTNLHLLDFFPQTDHTETIAVFRRG